MSERGVDSRYDSEHEMYVVKCHLCRLTFIGQSPTEMSERWDRHIRWHKRWAKEILNERCGKHGDE